ncbi:MAG: leucine-rich repeat domain-containing protein [Holosporaceae bacterium]
MKKYFTFALCFLLFSPLMAVEHLSLPDLAKKVDLNDQEAVSRYLAANKLPTILQTESLHMADDTPCPEWIANFANVTEATFFAADPKAKTVNRSKKEENKRTITALMTLPRLQELDIRNVCVPTLELAVRCNHLKKLTLQGAELWKLSVSENAPFPVLKQLILADNQLENIASLCQPLVLPVIEEIDLSNNRFDDFPPIHQLSALRVFKGEQLNAASSGRTPCIPDNIERLRHLTTLQLAQNDFYYLPQTIGGLTKLEILDCANNRLGEPYDTGEHFKSFDLPPGLFRLTKLRHLNLSANQLKNLPPQINQLRSLSTLHLKYNPFRHFPRTLLAMLPQLDGKLGTVSALESTDEAVGKTEWEKQYTPSKTPPLPDDKRYALNPQAQHTESEHTEPVAAAACKVLEPLSTKPANP